QRLPMAGGEVLSLLSPGQKQLLQEAHVSIDWTRVKRIADIQSTTWQVKSQPNFKKFVLELWEWPTGSVLELSSKVAAEAGPSALTELQRLASMKSLSLDSHRGPKTAAALQDIIRPENR